MAHIEKFFDSYDDGDKGWLTIQEAKAFFAHVLDMNYRRKSARLKFRNILKVADPEVYDSLQGLNIIPEFFALRWIMNIMCQKFDMKDCIRLWDSFIADGNRFEYLIYLCAAIIIQVREDILGGDFSVSMETSKAYAKH